MSVVSCRVVFAWNIQVVIALTSIYIYHFQTHSSTLLAAFE